MEVHPNQCDGVSSIVCDDDVGPDLGGVRQGGSTACKNAVIELQDVVASSSSSEVSNCIFAKRSFRKHEGIGSASP